MSHLGLSDNLASKQWDSLEYSSLIYIHKLEKLTGNV